MDKPEPVENYHYWQESADLMDRWGVKAFVVSLLDSLGPLTIVGAQIAYIGQPMLSSLINPEKYRVMVGLLEDSEQMKTYIAYLQGKEST
jgi:hypothetical protein